MHTNTARSISDLPSALKKQPSHSLQGPVTVTRIIKHKDMLITLTKEENAFISTYLLSSKNIETQCIQKKNQNYTAMCMKSTFPLSWIYIYGDIYTIQAVLVKDNHWVFLKPESHESLSFFTFTSPARMVAISPCIKAQGTLEPTRGHFSPLGQ